MARRTLRNLDQKIIRETISLGAKQGISKLNVRTLAKICGITDTTIYIHFQTKKNLLQKAFLYIEDKLSCLINGATAKNCSVKEIWLSMLDYFVKHETETIYFDAYGHAEFETVVFKDTESSTKSNFVRKLAPEQTTGCTEAELMIVWIYVLEATMNLARFIIEQKIPYDQKTTDLFFDLIIGKLL